MLLFYGTDAITFTATADALPGVFRKFDSLAVCADEVGMSRIYGGFHYMFDNVQGKATGKQVGDYVSANFLLPNDALPRVRLEDFHVLARPRLDAADGAVGDHHVQGDCRRVAGVHVDLGVVPS